MKTYSFNVGVDVWIKGVEIEANSEEEARNKFNQLSLEEMMVSGCVKNEDFYSIDVGKSDNEEDEN